jgi:hypothetical protein
MSKMASHESFGHLKHKLWSKERSGVKLAIWLSTTKSQESTWPWCVQMECDTLLESPQRELQVCFRPHPNLRSEQRIMNSQSFGSPKLGQFRDSSLGVPRQNAIRMWVLRSNAENTMWGKVVASPEFRPWWVLRVQSCPWLILAPKVLQNAN